MLIVNVSSDLGPAHGKFSSSSSLSGICDRGLQQQLGLFVRQTRPVVKLEIFKINDWIVGTIGEGGLNGLVCNQTLPESLYICSPDTDSRDVILGIPQ